MPEGFVVRLAETHANSRARPAGVGTSRCVGGAAALLLALGTGTATMALLAHERPAYAQPAPTPYVQKDIADQVAKGEAAVRRCDKAAARKELDKLKKTKEFLDGAAKSGFVQGAPEDAKKLEADLKGLESLLSNCKDTHKATGPGGEIYGFSIRNFSIAAGKYIDDAQRAARDCDRDLYKAVIKALHDAIDAHVKNFKMADGGAAALSIETLKQLERDLIANEAEAFKKCAEPGKAEAPKEPAKTDAPKTGTGTGTGTTPGQPPKPPETPKAPPMDPPGMGAMFPANIFGPQPGLVGELVVAMGFRNNSALGGYTSNGAQAPGDGSGSDTQFNIGGSLGIWWPIYQFGVGPVWRRPILEVAQSDGPRPPMDDDILNAEWAALGTLWFGGRVTIDYLGDGRKQVLEIVRHGPNGFVTLSESERTMVSLLLLVKLGIWFNLGQFGWGPAEAGRDDQYADTALAQAPRRRRANWWPVNFYAGVGPSFVSTKIAMTSNQAPGGGVAESASQTKTDTAWSFVLGAQTPVCRNCIFGMPLMAGVEGQWTWLPARSVSVTSSTFGFTETGRVSSRSSSRVMFTFSVPFAIGR